MMKNLIEDLDVYTYNKNKANWYIILVPFIYPTTWPVITYRYGSWIRKNFRVPIIYRILYYIYYVMKMLSEITTGVEIRDTAEIGKGLFIPHAGNIVIGKYAKIGNHCVIVNGVTIGGAGRGDKFGYPTIGNNVFVGTGAKILGKIHIGNNVMIGANAVVVKSVPDNAVVAGIPAKIISYEGNWNFIKYRNNSF